MRHSSIFLLLLATSFPVWGGVCSKLVPDSVYTPAHRVLYESRIEEPGTRIMVDDIEYTLIRVPFMEFRSKDRYAVTFPVDTNFFREFKEVAPALGWPAPRGFSCDHRRPGPLRGEIPPLREV